MSNRQQAGKPSRYVIVHLSQLSLAIPPWVGAMSISKKHTARCSSLVTVVSQYKTDVWLGATETKIWFGKDFAFTLRISS